MWRVESRLRREVLEPVKNLVPWAEGVIFQDDPMRNETHEHPRGSSRNREFLWIPNQTRTPDNGLLTQSTVAVSLTKTGVRSFGMGHCEGWGSRIGLDLSALTFLEGLCSQTRGGGLFRSTPGLTESSFREYEW